MTRYVLFLLVLLVAHGCDSSESTSDAIARRPADGQTNTPVEDDLDILVEPAGGQTNTAVEDDLDILVEPAGGRTDTPVEDDLDIFVKLDTFLEDDLDILATPGTSAKVRGELYRRLSKVEFSSIAHKLAMLIVAHHTQHMVSGVGPRTKQPWNEKGLGELDRIYYTLTKLWSHLRDDTGAKDGHFELLLSMVEDSSLGQARSLPLGGVKMILHFRKRIAYRDLPPIGKILARLDRLVRDQTMPNYLRRRLVTVLFEHGDPNQYLELAISLCSSESTVHRRSEAFRLCTPTYQASKLSPRNLSRFLRHTFSMLKKIDDGKSGSGTGSFLVGHIGHYAGVKPVRRGQGPFTPDLSLSKYKGKDGHTYSVSQDTINNALDWWERNKHLHREAAQQTNVPDA